MINLPPIIAGDVETAYAADYSVKTMLTQKYIEDPRFQAIGWSFAYNDFNTPAWGTSMFYPEQFDWKNHALLAHNAKFDAAILEYHYGIKPAFVFCTMAMAQTIGLGKVLGGVSLELLANFFAIRYPHVNAKGTEVHDAKGKWLKDFTPTELAAYGEYCNNDVYLTNVIYDLIRPYVDEEELLFHSMMHKAFSEPCLQLDVEKLKEEQQNIMRRKAEVLKSVAHIATKTQIGSNQQFADVLKKLGVAVPMKVNPKGKQAFAFAKTDVAFTDLGHHENEDVRLIVAARLDVKSNTEITRINRMLDLAVDGAPLRIPMKIAGAHTLRASGQDKINVQNFPSGRVPGQSKTLRKSLVAPKGYKLTAPDSGQIEARILAVLANDEELMHQFYTGQCPYSIMGEIIFRVPAAEIKAGSGRYKGGDGSAKELYLMRQTGKAAILQLGYQAGEVGFFTSLTGTYGVDNIDQSQCSSVVQLYRKNRPMVKKFWYTCEDVISDLCNGREGYFGGADGKMFYYNGKQDWFGEKIPSILLPNNTWLTYPMMKQVDVGGRFGEEAIYISDMALFRTWRDRGEPMLKCYKALGKKLYGGKLTENLCQAAAFAVLKWQGIRMEKHGKFCSNVHDEHVMAVKEDKVEQAAEYFQRVMQTTPPYMKGAKFECEYGIADNFGDC